MRYFLLTALVFAVCPARMPGQTNPGVAEVAASQRDGQHDFDWEFGSWNVHVRRLQHPLTGSNAWIDFEGRAVVRKVWNGRANLLELEMDSPRAHLEGLSLRLYNPQSRRWSIYWATSSDGSIGIPAVGGFNNGGGEFFDQEIFHGTAIHVRFIFSDITSGSFRGEQSFSADGGKRWEPNWIETFTREKR